MSKTSILNGILLGLVIVLLGVIAVQYSTHNVAGAADAEDSAPTPRGVGTSANGVVAVTGQYANDASVLYLIDTNREVILTYACYPEGRSTSSLFNKPVFDFLNGRSYTWDAAYCQKGLAWGYSKGPKPGDVRRKMKDLGKE